MSAYDSVGSLKSLDPFESDWKAILDPGAIEEGESAMVEDIEKIAEDAVPCAEASSD